MSLLLLGVSRPEFTGVIDSVGVSAALAYGTRKLRTAYLGSAMRVRRSSDNAELDIGFIATGDLDTATLLTHCGAGNGFVVTWYDQSGNARDVTQSTAGTQPQIVSSGAVITSNSKPTIQFAPTKQLSPVVSLTLTCATGNHVARIADISGTYTVIRQQNTTSGNTWFLRYALGLPVFQANGVLIAPAAIVQDTTLLHVITGTASEAGNSKVLINGSQVVTGATMTPGATVGLMRVGESPAGGQAFSGNMSEILLFGTTLTVAQRQTLERNQGTYYGITVA